MLNQIHGVLGSGGTTKQGADEEEKIKTETYRKDNEASSSRKNKGKGIIEDENDENAMMSESERIAGEKRDKELDKLISLRKKFEAEAAEAKNANLILETQKSMFPA
ncbi:unnamed protein product [Lactuca saligna]|uniref:Uncharacterized protein n=1 Tax=Lactuca saligna TaxID=75948 RepID=A0AA35YLT5_LACSI|nr:unnamed protein product [Lactuca saligna]